MRKKDRIGETSVNNQGLFMEIIKYRDNKDMTIKFEDGTILEGIQYAKFKKGSVKNYNHPTVCGIGIVGYGKYKACKNGKHTQEYNVWYDIIQRCYDENQQKRTPTYIGCTVSDEFLNFQNFAEFYNQEKWTDEILLSPDKDILTHGKSKKYSRETILMVDRKINQLFVKSDKTRGEYLIGVCFRKQENKYEAQCFYNNKRKHLGLFDTEKKAFNAYKSFKEKHIKEVAEFYKNKYSNFPKKLYDAMVAYEVEEND